jgi:hypothetical protein
VNESAANHDYAKPIRAETGEEGDALVEEHEVVLAEFLTKGCARCDTIEPVLGNVTRTRRVLAGS